MDSIRLTAVAAATLAAACVAVPSHARGACGGGTYAYAGMSSRQAPAAPTVLDGHVDGWFGVGVPWLCPKGTDEWIQSGFTSISGDSLNRIYYEIQRPGHKDEYRELRHDVPVGAHHRFAVRELAGPAELTACVKPQRFVAYPVLEGGASPRGSHAPATRYAQARRAPGSGDAPTLVTSSVEIVPSSSGNSTVEPATGGGPSCSTSR